MLRPLLLLFFALSSTLLLAQFASPIRWEFSYERVQGDEFRLIAKASAEPGWAIYSQYTPEGGPIPTSFMWTKGKHFELVGKSEEKGHRKSGLDEMFGVDVIKFLSDEPTYFTQRVLVKDYGTPIEVTVEYMCCDDEQCLPPTDVVHAFVLPPAGPRQGANTSTAAPGAVGDAGNKSGNPGTGNAGSLTSPAPNSTSAPAAAPNTTTPLAIHTAVGTAATADDPVSWVFSAEQLAPDQYRLRMTGTMREGWTMYSKDVDPDPGATPTEFFVKTADGVSTLGPVEEISATLKVKYDKVWGADMAKIEGGTVVYQQTVALNGAQTLEGYVYYQTCDDRVCFPPKEVPFTLDLSGPTPVATIDGLTAPPLSTATASVLPANELGITVAFDPAPVGTCSEGEEITAGQGLWTIFGLGFIGGLFAMLMPCIFPMIPLTVSFFTKSGGTRAEGIRRASLYGFFIFLIYVLLSLPFHLLDGLDPGILNTIASSVPLNVAFFLIFLFFAGSFFGFYELTLPESWSNRASRAEGAGGIIGIFFMALTLALVSFSCTGPILGSLLVEAVSDGAWPLTAGMAGFGVALGLPFALFAAFPGFLNNLPKSGGWLNSVKVVLGFVEIALAFKFLSNADLVGEWDLLRIEPFLLIWILCALGIAAYLFKLISFPLDSKKRKIGVIGGLVGGAGIAFTAYLLLGLLPSSDTGTYRNLSLLSGIAPPVCYNYFLPCDETRNITPFKNLEEGLAYARKVNKPVMLDFTGYTCVNCRKMEENVWTENDVKRYLTDEYVIISLYTDDRSALPPAEHREVQRLDGSGRTLLINEVGKKWHYFQQTVYARSSQPYYVLVSPDGVTLNPPVAYTPDVEEYKNFLACGLSTYQRLVSSK